MSMVSSFMATIIASYFDISKFSEKTRVVSTKMLMRPTGRACLLAGLSPGAVGSLARKTAARSAFRTHPINQNLI